MPKLFVKYPWLPTFVVCFNIFAAIVAMFHRNLAVIVTRIRLPREQQRINSIVYALLPVFPDILSGIEFYASRKDTYTENKKRVYIHVGGLSHQGLVYVILHELAHVSVSDIGHTPLFYQQFDLLMQRAHQAGVYDGKTVVDVVESRQY